MNFHVRIHYLILFHRPASLLDGRISAVEPAMKTLAVRETMANIISNCRYVYDEKFVNIDELAIPSSQ